MISDVEIKVEHMLAFGNGSSLGIRKQTVGAMRKDLDIWEENLDPAIRSFLGPSLFGLLSFTL